MVWYVVVAARYVVRKRWCDGFLFDEVGVAACCVARWLCHYCGVG